MPIFEYTCKSCEKTFEHLQRSMATSGAGTDAVACPDCGSKKTKRALSLVSVAADTARSGGGQDSATTCGRCGGAPGSCGM